MLNSLFKFFFFLNGILFVFVGLRKLFTQYNYLEEIINLPTPFSASISNEGIINEKTHSLLFSVNIGEYRICHSTTAILACLRHNLYQLFMGRL